MIKRPADRSEDSADLAHSKTCKLECRDSSGAATPTQVSCAPTRVAAAPTRVSTAPDQAACAPDRDASAPTLLTSLQNKVAQALAQDVSVPIQTASAPQVARAPQVACAPAQDVKAQIQAASAPDKVSCTAAQVFSAPTQVSCAPTHVATAPTQVSTVPDQAARAPYRDGSASTKLASLQNQIARALAQASSVPTQLACAPARVTSGPSQVASDSVVVAAELSGGENPLAAKGSSKPCQKPAPPRVQHCFHPLPLLLAHRGRPRVKPRAFGRSPPGEDVINVDKGERKAGNDVSVVVVESGSNRVIPPKTPSALVVESGSSRVGSPKTSSPAPKHHVFGEPYIIDEDSLDAAAEETVTTSRQERTQGSKSGPQMCPVCKKIISNASNLRQHYNICHSSTERPFPCEICEKRFNTESNLRQHRRTHTGERPFPCPHCDRCFGTSTNLRQHERTHTGERPFACTECPRAFQTSSNLRQHLRIHSGERPYPCPECGKCFSSTPNLKQHRKTHENRRLEESRYAILQQNRIAALTKMVASGESEQNNKEPAEHEHDDSNQPDAVIYVEVEERQERDVSPNGTELIVGYQSVADGSA